MSPKAWELGSIETVTGSEAATARAARSAAKRKPVRSCRARAGWRVANFSRHAA
jgi:hypothetical protein